MIGAACLAAPFATAERVDDPADISAAVAQADIVIIGEIHDNPDHHAAQADILSTIAPTAVVFEMLNPDQAATVNRSDVTGAALGEALNWEDSGWPPFDLYAPIFAALDGAIAYGAALPREQVMGVMETGPASAFAGDAALFGLNQPLESAEQSTREAGQMSSHCDALPQEMLPGMVDAQRLRDAAFSLTTLTALSETDGPVVVITGNGHARKDWGMPRYLTRAAPDATVVSVGQIEAEVAPSDPPPFDIWRITAPIDRPDPCEAFRARSGGDG